MYTYTLMDSVFVSSTLMDSVSEYWYILHRNIRNFNSYTTPVGTFFPRSPQRHLNSFLHPHAHAPTNTHAHMSFDFAEYFSFIKFRWLIEQSWAEVVS